MLVVTANWAIPDGSVAAAPRAGLFPRLFADLRRSALQAGLRRDGRYRPIERIVLVLAGDTFDVVLSGRWLDGVRPWERRRQAAERRDDALRAAWGLARRPLAAVSTLARRGLAVPVSDRHGRPLFAGTVAVPVRVVMLLGDRDAVLEDVGVHETARRHAVAIGSAWNGDGLHVVHGSTSDPLGVRDGGPTLLESLTVDLLARFGAVLAARPALARGGRKLVRMLADGPMLDMPLRLRATLDVELNEGKAPDPIVSCWHRSVDRWVREARRVGCDDGHGTVEAIAAWMHSGLEKGPLRPATAAVLDTLSTKVPGAAGVVADRGFTVLGHPGPDHADGARVVCLGAATMRRFRGRSIPGPEDTSAAVSCVAAIHGVPAAALPAVVVFEHGEGGAGAGWRALGEAGGVPGQPRQELPILDAA